MMNVSTPLLIAIVAQSGGDPIEQSTKMAKTLGTFYRNVAARYEFVLKENETAAVLRKQPIMSWTGQEAGTVSGDVFVWIQNGRPEVIGCIGSLPGAGTNRGVFHEFHSITTEKSLQPVDLLTGRKWKPGTVGIKPAEVPDADKPADTAVRRMLQMRQFARDFVARMQVTLQLGADAGSDLGREKLRLLPQPLFRYDAKAIDGHPDVIDGTIFSYVWDRGTDPELLLLIEARKTNDGIKWMYAPVRLTFRELWLDHKGTEVWHDPAGNGRDTYTAPYVTEFDREYTLAEIKKMNLEQ